jgi:hypothetical protein
MASAVAAGRRRWKRGDGGQRGDSAATVAVAAPRRRRLQRGDGVGGGGVGGGGGGGGGSLRWIGRERENINFSPKFLDERENSIGMLKFCVVQYMRDSEVGRNHNPHFHTGNPISGWDYSDNRIAR